MEREREMEMMREKIRERKIYREMEVIWETFRERERYREM